LDGVTGLRALAAVWVLMFHLWLANAGPDMTISLFSDARLGLTRIFKAGVFGVDIFFVISGFLLTLPWIQPRPAGQALREIPGFYSRRLLRIIPAYYAVIFFVLYAFLFGLEPFPSTWHVFSQVFMLNGPLDILGIDIYLMRGVFWTLNAEIAFYLFLPFIAMVAHRVGWKTVIALLIACGMGFRLYLFLRFQAVDPFKMRFLFSMPGRLDMFAYGMVCACLFKKDRTGQKRSRILAESAFWLGVFCFMLTAQVWGLRGDMVGKGDYFYVIFPVFPAAGAALMIAAVMWKSRSAQWLLANPPMVFMGTISYSLYLWHTVFLDIMLKSGFVSAHAGISRYMHTALIILPVIFLVSYACYWWIERPFLKIRHHAGEVQGAFTTRHAIGLLTACGAALVAMAAAFNATMHT
jgi:peptidoglycan/LPS O-acetylase OafA/YrhL